MTEAEWLLATDPDSLVRLGYAKTGRPRREAERIHRRKVRLLACAACRRIWHLLADKYSRRAVEAAERWADRLIDVEVVKSAEERAAAVIPIARNKRREAVLTQSKWKMAMTEARHYAVCAAHSVASAEPHGVWDSAAWAAGYEAQGRLVRQANRSTSAELIAARDSGRERERKAQADLCRELFGNPFRTVSLMHSWLTPTVVSLARTVYEDRLLPSGSLDPILLTQLSDALELAGCHRQDVLDHCRRPGPHVRGCWVVDLVLVKV